MLWKKYLGILLCLQIVRLSEQDACKRTIDVPPGKNYNFSSLNYPDRFTHTGSSCRYKFVAPQDYEIFAECSVEIGESVQNDTQCSRPLFFISRDGDLEMRDAEGFCGKGSENRTSNFRSLAIAVKPTAQEGPAIEGRYLCIITARPQPCDCGWSQTSRIVGGRDAHVGEFPSMAAIVHLKDNSDKPRCGGTIISHRLVLTASHCIVKTKPEELFIVAGFTNISDVSSSKYVVLHTVQEIIRHPSFDSHSNDIAILKTVEDIEWSKGVGPACLPFNQVNNTFDGNYVILLGWGISHDYYRPENLQKVLVKVLKYSKCSSYYNVEENQICTYAKGKDACQFDSGGPVIKARNRQFLLGIINYGRGCAEDGGVNARVTSYLDWIEENSEDKFCYKEVM